MKNTSLPPGFLPALSLTLAASATAWAGAPAETSVEMPPPPTPWEIRASMYGWLTGLDGTTGVGALTSELDVSFLDIVDDLKMAAALQIEARNGRWGILADGMYVDLGASGPTPGPIYENVDVEMQQFIGELSVAYRVYESPSGFVDLYAGMRYNNLSLEFDGNLDLPGIQAVSNDASERVVNGLRERADAIAQPRISAFQAGTAGERTAIENQLTADIEAEADGRVKRDLEKQLVKIRRDGGLSVRDIASAKIHRAVSSERLQLVRSAAQLEVAQLRESVGAAANSDVAQARSRVQRAEEKLAAAINKQLVSKVPTEASADKDWLDPIVGVRAQWNINDRFFLAGKSDIGGFSVGSDLAWTLQATVGYNLTQKVSAELGYRYLHTDYDEDAFVYDVAQAGVFTSLNIKF
ncbi:MAG: hypothetical protein RLZZ398_227 [Verrucomicrobiota bacterium]|jgi:hypothetical protein